MWKEVLLHLRIVPYRFVQEAYRFVQEVFRTVQKAFRTVQKAFHTVQEAYGTVQSVQYNFMQTPPPKAYRSVPYRADAY